ncbi:MAG: DUF2244 domain-containing protein [Casimicrobiaceae bacterium]
MSTTRLAWQRRLASDRKLRWGVFAGLASVSIAMGLFLAIAVRGWPVLPFVGLELAVLLGAFLWVECLALDRDDVEIDARVVRVRRCRGLRVEEHRFDRAWVAVAVEDVGTARERLAMRQSGREVALGEFLPSDVRREMLRQLRLAIAA